MVIAGFIREFTKTRQLADRAIAQLSDAELHARLDDEANSVAVLMQHMAGNMRSRWTDFLTTRKGDLLDAIGAQKTLTPELTDAIKAAADQFKSTWRE